MKANLFPSAIGIIMGFITLVFDTLSTNNLTGSGLMWTLGYVRMRSAISLSKVVSLSGLLLVKWYLLES